MVLSSAWQEEDVADTVTAGVSGLAAPGSRVNRWASAVVTVGLGLGLSWATMPTRAADETLGLRRPPAYTGRVQTEAVAGEVSGAALRPARAMPVSTATQVQPPQDLNEPLFHDLPPPDAGATVTAPASKPSHLAEPTRRPHAETFGKGRQAAPQRHAKLEQRSEHGVEGLAPKRLRGSKANKPRQAHSRVREKSAAPGRVAKAASGKSVVHQKAAGRQGGAIKPGHRTVGREPKAVSAEQRALASHETSKNHQASTHRLRAAKPAANGRVAAERPQRHQPAQVKQARHEAGAQAGRRPQRGSASVFEAKKPAALKAARRPVATAHLAH